MRPCRRSAGRSRSVSSHAPSSPGRRWQRARLHKATRGELIRAGKYFEALPLARAAMASLEKTSPGSRHFAGALNNLAQLYGDLGRDAEAEPLQKRALAIMDKAVGLDSQDISQDIAPR
jgi:tetratricopeptide (TPR) repeat protein